jgi:ATPase, P-type (transporting), HAD superfamily, subfamily IC
MNDWTSDNHARSLSGRWYLKSAEETAGLLVTNPEQGLQAEEAKRRFTVYGPNEITETSRRNPVRMFLDQFADFMIIVLIIAGIIAGIIGEPQDTIAILVIVILNTIIGFTQEYRTERAVTALKSLSAPSARVCRDGHVLSLPANQLVPGDLVLLETGNIVPADLRLVEAYQLQVQEAILTGESQAVDKITAVLHEKDMMPGDCRNLVFRDTQVTYGRGKGIVVATGMQTEIGKVARLLIEEEEVKSPLQKRITIFGQRLAFFVLAICTIIFAVGLLRGEPPVLMFLTAVSLAVAAIPEALPAVVTVSLAIGARNMVKKNALIRKLPAVETLGSVTYICSDKTGTLTENKMRVAECFSDNSLIKSHKETDGFCLERNLPEIFLRALALNNDVIRDAQKQLMGDPTEIALYETAARGGYEGAALSCKSERIAEIPFDAARKLMTTIHRQGDAAIAYTKGAPERLLERCTTQWTSQGAIPAVAGQLLTIAERMAADGLRVLAVAFRFWPILPENRDSKQIENNLCFLGFVGLQDPPRPEVHGALRLCRSAGIRPVMITGDHPATAQAIAVELGIAGHGDIVVTGRELEQMSLEDFEKRVEEVRVYARVAPEQKIRIIRALQDKGEFVAMTGDGINDAPALKRADIGIAMGKIGTDVARKTAHMVLLDDNFATIVTAVREGRRIFDNIRKFIKYAMTTNSAEIWTLFLAPFLLLPVPLLPIHILWINLITDGLPGLALALEPEDRRIMQRPPRPPDESVFAHGMWQHILWAGLLMSGVSLFAQSWAYRTGSAHWQSIVFTVLTLSQMFHVLAIRSEEESLFRQGVLSNLPLLGAVLFTFALQMVVLYLPMAQSIFKTAALTMPELLACLALSSVVFIAVEIEKWLRRRNRNCIK